MAAKVVFIVCAQALLIQSTFSQCINRGAMASTIGAMGLNRGWGCDGLGYDALNWNKGVGIATPLDFSAASGGGLPIASSSCMVPIGLSVVSENVFEGIVSVIGELPFIGAVALEGTLPSSGSGSINYGCGNGYTGMVSEGLGPAVGSPFSSPARMGCGYGDLLL